MGHPPPGEPSELLMDPMAMILFGAGGLACGLNFYLSFLRYAVHRLSGGTRDDYRWISGVPLIGSLLVAVSLVGLWPSLRLVTLAIILILIDTGGLHWFAGTMLYHALFRGRTHQTTDSAEVVEPSDGNAREERSNGSCD